MPTNLMLADSQFPRLDQGENTEQSIYKLQNYLYMLVEQLRYSLHNLDLSNLNSAAWEEMKLEISKPIYVSLKNSTGGSAELAATVSELSTKVEQQGQSISQFQQTANSLSASVSGLQTGMSQTLRMDATGVYITDANGKVVSINGGQINANTLHVNAANVDGAIMAAGLVAETIYLGANPIIPAGYIALTSADSTDAQKIKISSGAIELNACPGDVFIQGGPTDDVANIQLGAAGGDYSFVKFGGRIRLNQQSYGYDRPTTGCADGQVFFLLEE